MKRSASTCSFHSHKLAKGFYFFHFTETENENSERGSGFAEVTPSAPLGFAARNPLCSPVQPSEATIK